MISDVALHVLHAEAGSLLATDLSRDEKIHGDHYHVGVKRSSQRKRMKNLHCFVSRIVSLSLEGACHGNLAHKYDEKSSFVC